MPGSSGVRGGRYSRINGIPAVKGWQINDNGTLASFVDSGTAIGHGRRKGINSWAGQYASHGGVPSVVVGSLFGFSGYTAPDTDILGEKGAVYTGNAMANSVNIVWDWVSGNVLEHQVTFDGDLALVESFGYPPSLESPLPDPEEVGPTFIEYSSDQGVTWTTLAHCLQANLQFTNSVQGYVDSDTASGTGRKAGVFDASANIVIHDTIMGSGLTKGNPYIFKFHTTASLAWTLKWMRVKEYTGLQLSQETGAVVQYNVVLEQAGVEDVSSVPTLGSIKNPAGTSIWGTP